MRSLHARVAVSAAIFILLAAPAQAQLPSPAYNHVDVQSMTVNGGPVSTLQVMPQGGTTARTLGQKLGDTLSLMDFGAHCDGVTDDTAAINVAMVSLKRISIPSGLICYGASVNQAGITGVFVGPGQIKTSDGSLRGPFVAQITSAPSSSAPANVVQGFEGDLSHVLGAYEHRVTNNALPLPAAGSGGAKSYAFVNELSATVFSDYFGSGGNAANGSTPNAQRTGYATHVTDLTQAGQGDAGTHFSNIYVQGPNPGSLPIPGQTSFLQGPAGSALYVSISAGAPGVYLQGIGDINLSDNDYDVAAIGSVVNLTRTNNTGALGNTWIGHRVQSNGAVPSDAAFSAAGKYRIVLDAVDALAGGTMTAVSAGPLQRYYGNSSQASANQFPSSVNLGTEWFDYNPATGWEFFVGSNSVMHASAAGVFSGTGQLISADAQGTIGAQLVAAKGAAAARPLSVRAADQLNVRDFGAAGNGQATAIGTSYGSTLAALASYVAPGGATPFSWATNPAFGLTFTMTTTAAQGAPGTTLTFLESLISHEGLPFQATVASWQDPSNGNFLLKPGMLVSGSCIASGTTVQGWTTTTVRQGELLPGATDWAAGTAYAANAVVAANGEFYQATTGGTSGSSGGPTGTGTGISDGSVVWKFLIYGESTQLPNGNVTLSQATSSACPGAAGGAGYTTGGANPTFVVTTAPTSGAYAPGLTVTIEETQVVLGALQSGTASSVGAVYAASAGTPAIGSSSTANGEGPQSAPAGMPITFTISPAQLQALTVDWLGIQTAMAQAWAMPTGARVYIPAGTYEINHPLMNAGGMTNTNTLTQNIEITGDGYALTQIVTTVDFGQDECAMAESNRGQTGGREVSSFSAYREFRLNDLGFEVVQPGVSPAHMDGLCVGADARLFDVQTQGYRAGVTLVKDHQELHGVVSTGNGYGILLAPYSETMGNQLIEDGGLVGNEIASVGITSSDQLDSSTMKNVHTGFSPYGFYAPPSTPNVTATNGGMVSNTTLMDVWTEAVGEGWMYGTSSAAQVGNNTLINTGGTAVNYGVQISNGQGGNVQAKALIYVYGFHDNTMINTQMGAYGSVTDAIIEANGAGGCQDNLWIGDYFFVTGSNGSISALECNYGPGASNNSFRLGEGDGVFRQSGNDGAALPANMPVQDGYAGFGSGTLIAAYSDGNPFLGVTAAASAFGNWVGVWLHHQGLSGMPSAYAAQSIAAGQPIFPTTGGIAGGLDNDGAIGVSINGCAAAPSNGSVVAGCVFSLNPQASGGAKGFKTMAAASGNPVITARNVDVTSGTGGIGLSVGVPNGSQATICNDTGAAIAVVPQSGATFQGAATTNSLAAGLCGVYRHVSQSLWHT